MFFTLGFKRKQFIYSSIDNFHKPVLDDNTRNTTKVIVTLSLVFLNQSCYVKKVKYFGTTKKFGHLWNNIEIDFEIVFEVVVEVADVEVVVVDEEMKIVDFVHMVEIRSTHQNDGRTS